MTNVVGYARYSSGNQRQESIDAQVRAIKNYCLENDYTLIKIYIDEAVSATTDQREDFLQMIADSKNGQFQYCIVHKLDRFARNRYDSAFYKRKLEQNGVKLLSVLEQFDDTPESVVLESVLEGMAEYYSKNLSREVKKGLNENALAGKHNGGVPPLGFDVTPSQGYKINAAEAKAVELIFSLYADGYGYNLICDELNRQGFRTKRGQPFGKNSIAEILRNEKYIGRYVYNKRKSKKSGNRVYKSDDEITRIDGAMPQIISIDLWERVQGILTNRKRKPRQNGKHYYLLTGYLTCGECGSAFVGSGYVGGRGGKKYYQYSCVNRKNHKGCSNKPIRSDLLESVVLSKLSEFFTANLIDRIAQKIVFILQEQDSKSTQARQRLEEKLRGIEHKIQKSWDLYYADMLPMDQAAEQVKRLNAVKSNLSNQLANISPSVSSVDLEEIRNYLINCCDNLKSADTSIQRAAIDALLGGVVIYPYAVKIQIRIDPKKINADRYKVGGDEGNRTPVRRPLTKAFYECSYCFEIPQPPHPITGLADRYPLIHDRIQGDSPVHVHR